MFNRELDVDHAFRIFQQRYSQAEWQGDGVRAFYLFSEHQVAEYGLVDTTEQAVCDDVFKLQVQLSLVDLPARKLSGVVLEGRGVLRPGYTVVTGAGEGITTSGTFSPTLEKAIALARVPADAEGECQVEIRGKPFPARLVRPPFARHGKACL